MFISVIEDFELGIRQVDQVGAAELTGIKAVFEAVEVVEGGAAQAARAWGIRRRGSRSLRHGTSEPFCEGGKI
jgi:hypothetical protein